jgi:hypothetical protein
MPRIREIEVSVESIDAAVSGKRIGKKIDGLFQKAGCVLCALLMSKLGIGEKLDILKWNFCILTIVIED